MDASARVIRNLARVAAGPVRWLHVIAAWLLGYRDVPRRNRLSFRIDFQSQLLWAAMMALAQPTITQTIAVYLMPASGDMIQAVLRSAAAIGSLGSFVWPHLARGRSSLRFLLVPSTLAGLCGMAVSLVPSDRPYLFALMILLMHLAFSGVVTARSAVWHLNYRRAGVGNIVSRLQISGIVAGAVFGALAGWLITTGRPTALGRLRDLVPFDAETSYRGLFLLLGVCGIAAGLLCQRDRQGGDDDLPAENGKTSRVSLLASLRILRLDQPYRRFLSLMMIFGFGTIMSDTVLVLMMRERFPDHGSAVQTIIYLVLVPLVIQLAVMPFAGRLLDRTNPMRVRVYGAMAWGASRMFLLAAALAGSFPLLIVALGFSGLGSGLGAVAWQLGHMHFARPDLVEHYMGLHVTSTGLRGLIAPYVAIALWRGWSAPSWLGGWHVPEAGAFLFAVSFVMQVAGGVGFWWMDRRYRTLTPLGPDVVV